MKKSLRVVEYGPKKNIGQFLLPHGGKFTPAIGESHTWLQYFHARGMAAFRPWNFPGS